ncbi:hypothetical protein [Psychrobacter sp. Cmf 22.2]|uniref:hypothetical protein n=1 Tax=Psychrobacter sp. Cmf 22.2 TaxID=1926478 RepID=UPI00094709E4|nr:hypothetical protein [Psychrobacter sp. Cmf 22.2]OLF35920.1 hypothetical protein BTV98_12220 [Psychrobacter sp. Cmf 22.2]
MVTITRNILVIISTGISISAIAQEPSVTYQLTGDDFILEKNLTPSLVSTPLIASKKPDTQIDWTVMASAHSPAQPIAAFIKDWDAPLESGTHAYAQGRASLNVRPADSPISYGLAWRYDYMMTFNQETADLYWQYQNKQLPNQNQTYAIELDAQHNERIGANVGFAQQLTSNWQLTTYANIWKGLHLLDGEARGSITSQAYLDGETVRNIDRLNRTKTYVDYYYDEPALGEENLNWYPKKPTGYGYSLDINLTGALTDRTQLSIRGYDLLGRMHWKDTPSTQYVLDYDASRRPVDMTEGQLDTDDITQTLPWRVEGSLIHQLNPQWQLGVHGQVNDIQDLYQLSAGYQTNEDFYPLTITGLIEPQTQALGLAVDSQHGGIKLLTDSLDSEKAQRSEVSLYGRYSW